MTGLLVTLGFAVSALVWFVWLCREEHRRREEEYRLALQARARADHARDLVVVLTRNFEGLHEQLVVTRQAIAAFGEAWARAVAPQVRAIGAVLRKIEGG